MNRDEAISKLAEILEAQAYERRVKAERALGTAGTVHMAKRDFHAEASEMFDNALNNLVFDKIIEAMDSKYALGGIPTQPVKPLLAQSPWEQAPVDGAVPC